MRQEDILKSKTFRETEKPSLHTGAKAQQFFFLDKEIKTKHSLMQTSKGMRYRCLKGE
jgi:hypothetical protein